jgi:hypothetical protein
MRFLLHFLISGALPFLFISSCSNVLTDAPHFEFQTEATWEPRLDKVGNYEDYLLKDTRVRFCSVAIPSDLRSWNGFGTDGEYPREILNEVSIKSKLGHYELPVSFINDLGNPNIRPCNNYNYVKINQESAVLQIIMSNSDGAGSYRVFFVIDLLRGRAKRYISGYDESKFSLSHNWTPMKRKGERCRPIRRR